MVEINHEITAKWGSEPAPFEVEVTVDAIGFILPPLIPTITFNTDGALEYQNYQIWLLETRPFFR